MLASRRRPAYRRGSPERAVLFERRAVRPAGWSKRRDGQHCWNSASTLRSRTTGCADGCRAGRRGARGQASYQLASLRQAYSRVSNAHTGVGAVGFRRPDAGALARRRRQPRRCTARRFQYGRASARRARGRPLSSAGDNGMVWRAASLRAATFLLSARFHELRRPRRGCAGRTVSPCWPARAGSRVAQRRAWPARVLAERRGRAGIASLRSAWASGIAGSRARCRRSPRGRAGGLPGLACGFTPVMDWRCLKWVAVVLACAVGVRRCSATAMSRHAVGLLGCSTGAQAGARKPRRRRAGGGAGSVVNCLR